MTATIGGEVRVGPDPLPSAARRLRPLAVGIGLQNLLLWALATLLRHKD